ncbi:cupin domain-containing protein [Streptomyces sp. NPDC050658]|uniref:cupin domain-containing protein n=1 Tax=unclassified Streptomyces TaxID=2593676 RepID=UPI00342DF5AE
MAAITPALLAERYGLKPLPVEGGLFARTWAGPEDAGGRAAGSAIMMLLTAADGDFSALHRLPIDEVWHFYQGDPLELLLLHPDGTDEVLTLGHGIPDQRPQAVVPAGTWMGAAVAPGGSWSFFGTTMAPGFLPEDYEGGDAGTLAARHPGQAARIRALCRADAPTRMPDSPRAAEDAPHG